MSFHSHALAALSLVAAGLATYGVFSGSPALVEEPILTVYSTSLTAMQLTAATDKQDVLPIALQRGSRIDGTLRGRPLEHMAIQGNPYEKAWLGTSLNGVRLETGTYDVSDVDLALPAEGFPWVVGRTYNNRQDVSGAYTSNGPQGKQWFQESMPEIALYTAGASANDILYLFYGADRFVEYRRAGTSLTTFRGRNGAAGVFKFISGGISVPDLYVLYDQNGNELTFWGFDGDAAPAQGQLWRIKDPTTPNVAYVGDASNMATALSNGYTSPEGYISVAYDTSGRRYSYSYANDAASTLRLTQVKAEINTGSWVEVGRVDYEYYGNESYGDVGDLKLVEITTPLTDSGVSVTKKKYYRYWEGSAEGAAHDLKMIVDFEGTRAYDWLDTTFDEDFLSQNDATLKPYSSAYFEYDGSHRITSAFFNGQCGCSGGSAGTYTISYDSNGSFSGTSGYDQAWKDRAVVLRPDGSYVTQYFDEVGQPLSQVVTDGIPTGSPNRWATRVTRDTSGRVDAIYTPASATGYTHSTGAITSSSSVGLIWTFPRVGADARTGFASNRSWQVGTSGTSYFIEEYEYEDTTSAFKRSINSGESYVYRPILKDTLRYPSKDDQDPGDEETTTTDPDESSAALAIEYILTTNPKVVAAENGSDATTSRTQYFRDDGTPSFLVAEDGVATYTEYTNGQLTKRIDDADDNETGDFDVTPPGTSADAVHRITTYTYDAQGRRATETQADGRVLKIYYSKLADGRLVTLVYSDFIAGTPKFYGPVQYAVANHAGKPVVQATVALSSNESTTALTGHVDETDADPITAMDLGTIVRMTAHLYDEAGQRVESSRVYHDVPASGAGSAGANYDETLFGYDDMGRQWRVKEPHGTITRTVFDDLGRTIEHWIGKNDYSFAGGAGAGPDDMVKTEELEYDGGADDGNGYVTERTQFVEGSGTGSRVTAYTDDDFGRVLLETRPTAPHGFNKYDNLGRRIATALYSSTAGIVAASEDPTTEATSRLALSKTDFDGRGQVWKTTRHQIDANDGSDDDNLETLNWYDSTGRLIKVDGQQLTKTFYDRLGRQTQQFILAKALNSGAAVETAYGDADDLGYDIVLEEHQTVYESSNSDDVLMGVAIARFHDDFGGSATVGLLDTNADNDRLEVTAADLEGRADITGFWYDRFGRITSTVRYGTYGGTDFNRAGLSVSPRSDTALRTDNTWETDGTVKDVTDPKALVARTLYDDAGRTIATIRNYVNGTPSAVTGEDDVYTRYTYLDSLRSELWVDFDGDGVQDGNDEVTTYTYGTVKGASAGDSKIATGHLLQKIAYPDSSSGSDVVTFAYNAQNQEIYKKDQAGNVLETEFDTSGRRTKLKAITVIGGFDNAVERIQSAYTSLGQVETVTSYDDPASGSAVNEVKYAYDGWGNVTSFKQDRDGTVGGSGFYEVAYTWTKATTGRNTLRKSGATLPSGATLTYDYISSGGRHDDAVSRVSRILHGATNVVQYGYNGVAQLVGTDYRQPTIMWLIGSTGGSYPDLDIFNRVTSSRWTTDLTTDRDFFDLDITYDRNSNITRVEDNVHVGFDWSYTMDNMDRLSNAQRGIWGGSSITTEKEEQTWTLMDQVGNWDLVKLDLNGDNDYIDADEYNDDRTHNTVNELTSRDTDDNGTDNYTLTYDAAGNLTDDAESFEYVYDPFGRLRKVNNQSSALVAEYKYNGLGHMIAVHEDTDIDLDVDANDKWFYPVHDERWRMVANFRESDTAPKEEWVNQDAGLDGRGGSSYVNGVVFRNKDANTAWTSASDGTLEERIYLCQNWRGDVSALVYSNGDQVEQVRYSPYGTPFGLPAGDTDSDGDCDATDVTQIQTWINAPAYNMLGDIDLDGDVDATDKSIVQASYQGRVLRQGGLSSIGSDRGLEGGRGFAANRLLHARERWRSAILGQWLSRDPLGQVDGSNLYNVLSASPVVFIDSYGLQCTCPGESLEEWTVFTTFKREVGKGMQPTVADLDKACVDDGPPCTCDTYCTTVTGDASSTGGYDIGACEAEYTEHIEYYTTWDGKLVGKYWGKWVKDYTGWETCILKVYCKQKISCNLKMPPPMHPPGPSSPPVAGGPGSGPGTYKGGPATPGGGPGPGPGTPGPAGPKTPGARGPTTPGPSGPATPGGPEVGDAPWLD